MYTIGIPEIREWEAALRDPIATLGEVGMLVERVTMPDKTSAPWVHWPNKTRDPHFGWLVPLPFCSIAPDTDLVIAAVLARQDPAYNLAIPASIAIPDAPMQIALDASVFASDVLGESYLTDARPDLRMISAPETGAAILGPWPEASAGPPTLNYTLHVREFPPLAGAGVWAIVTHAQSLDLRRFLKQIHHPEVSRLTNVERALEKQFQGCGVHCCGIHCEEDAQGYIHLWMAWKRDAHSPVERAGVFSATTIGLEALAWAKTGLNFD